MVSSAVVEPGLTFTDLSGEIDLSGFACRNPVFSAYLQQRARQDQRRRAANVVFLQADESTIAGFYTISATGLALIDIPSTLQKRLPRYPVVPAVLIGRLALDERFERKGLGAVLLADAIDRAARLDVAVWCVVVDAIDEAAVSFYEHFGFVRLESAPNRLVLPIQTWLKARDLT